MRLGSLVPFDHKKKSAKHPQRLFMRWKNELGTIFFKIFKDLGATFPECQEIKIDVYDANGHMIIMAELPGVQDDDITISLLKGTLTIQGIKRQEAGPENHRLYLAERCYGSFSRSFHLPFRVDISQVHKEFSKGVLVLTIPKKRKHTPSSPTSPLPPVSP